MMVSPSGNGKRIDHVRDTVEVRDAASGSRMVCAPRREFCYLMYSPPSVRARFEILSLNDCAMFISTAYTQCWLAKSDHTIAASSKSSNVRH